VEQRSINMNVTIEVSEEHAQVLLATLEQDYQGCVNRLTSFVLTNGLKGEHADYAHKLATIAEQHRWLVLRTKAALHTLSIRKELVYLDD
jgi:CRISPR/Cas system CMR-associated protein Cmr5 small subunit